MDRSTFNALPKVSSLSTAVLAVSAGGVAVGSYFLLNKDSWQQNNSNVVRVSYYLRVSKIKENGTFNINSDRTNAIIRGWTQGSNPASRTVNTTDPFTGAVSSKTITVAASGSWPDGAVDYDTKNVRITTSTFQDFPAGASQQTDGFVRIYDILT